MPLISSWESLANPVIPPADRLADIAIFFATRRSIDGKEPRLLGLEELTPPERAVQTELARELTSLRDKALAVASPSRDVSSEAVEIAASLNTGLYRIEPGNRITIVCAQLPSEMLQRMPYTDPLDPDFIELYRYSDLGALVELFGHLRATNPTSRVRYRAADRLGADDYSGHLVSLGGVDWNKATRSALDRLQLPVR